MEASTAALYLLDRPQRQSDCTQDYRRGGETLRRGM